MLVGVLFQAFVTLLTICPIFPLVGILFLLIIFLSSSQFSVLFEDKFITVDAAKFWQFFPDCTASLGFANVVLDRLALYFDTRSCF